MTLDEYKVPKELLLQFDGVAPLVRPNIEYLGKRPAEMPGLATSDGLEQLYTDSILHVYHKLEEGKEDGYDKLSDEQPLVKSGYLRKESMKDFLNRFVGQFNDYFVRSELLDFQPKKRIEGYEMDEGSNAILYRNWEFSHDTIDVSKATVTPVRWMEKENKITTEVAEKLGAPKGKYAWYSKTDVEGYDGISVLDWDFRHGWVSLGSDKMPLESLPRGGALLGSRVKTQQMVKDFGKKLFSSIKVYSQKKSLMRY